MTSEPHAPTPTPADTHGYWSGSNARSRQKTSGGAVALLSLLVLGVGIVVLANRHGTEFNHHGSSSLGTPQTLAVQASPVVDANQFTLMSNERASAINSSSAAMAASPRTLADMRQEFLVISLADRTLRDRLVASNFSGAARPDVQALVASLERLITADAQIVSAPDDMVATDAYKRYLDADASEKAAAEMLSKTLRDVTRS